MSNYTDPSYENHEARSIQYKDWRDSDSSNEIRKNKEQNETKPQEINQEEDNTSKKIYLIKT